MSKQVPPPYDEAVGPPGESYPGLGPGLDSVGTFHLLRALGRGGMAQVWLAVDARDGRQVAVKRMLPGIGADPELRRAFLDEAELGLRLKHPNIVETLELGEVTMSSGVEPYLVLELLQGRALIDVLRAASRRRMPLPLPMVIRAVVDAARALDYAHSLTDADGQPLRLVHRDVSPHNLFACTDGRIKLLDFGIAKSAAQQHETRTGLIKGKLPYFAPEQIRGHEADPRVDVFALGVVLHELLVGAPLFRGANDAETLHKVLHLEVAPPETLRPDVPPGLSAIALHALKRDPDRRLPSCGALADAIEAVAEAEDLVTTRTDVRACTAELFPKDALAHAERSALARRTYENLSSGSLRALDASDPWLTPPAGAPIRHGRWRGIGLVAGALALTTAAAYTTSSLMQRHAPRVNAPTVEAPPIRVEPLAPAPVEPARVERLGPAAGRVEPIARASTAKRAHAAGHGRLRVAAHPWAEVSVDGKPAGTTPLPSSELDEGPHHLVFSNQELGVTVRRRVTIRRDKESVVIVDLFAAKAR